MIEQILFIISGVAVINLFFLLVAGVLGNTLTLPTPAFHLMGYTYANTYISSFSLAYQIYFWSNYFNIFA